MYSSDEKLCLKWNDFQDNVTSTFRERRKDMEFADVTLACEDGQQVEAHKVILASASPFFLDLLKRNKHPHPLIYMRGIKSEDLVAIVDFLYYGEANVYQENLDYFLSVAAELKLKGLSGKQPIQEEPSPTQTKKTTKPFSKKEQSIKSEQTELAAYTDINETQNENHMEEAVAVTDNTVAVDLQNLDSQIDSMITAGQEKGKSCIVCGKQGSNIDIRRHIEAVHITGVSHICNICGNTSRSRHGLKQHVAHYHK